MEQDRTATLPSSWRWLMRSRIEDWLSFATIFRSAKRDLMVLHHVAVLNMTKRDFEQ
jgi:hypothetical protein